MRGNHHRTYARSQTSRVTDDLSGITPVTNGYWWHARFGTGIGTTGFLVPESGGHTTFDQIQATVANQPTVLSENNSTQYRMRKQADTNPSRLATAGTLQVGWTGATYAGAWVRLPDTNADITGNCNILTHNLTTGNQRRLLVNCIATNDSLQVTGSSDGTNGATVNGIYRSANIFAGVSDWYWLEAIFDPLFELGGSLPIDKFKLYKNLAALSTTTTTSSADVTALFDAAAAIQIGCQSASSSNVDTTDWASVFYLNGIPSVGDRRRIAGYYPPRTITF